MNPRATICATLILTALVSGLLAPVAVSPASASAASKASSYADRARTATNHHRAAHDLRTLRRGECVQRFAVRQAARMARRQEMFHQDLGPVLHQCHLNLVGENVAMGYPTGRATVNQGWMKSEHHRDNILDGRFAKMGIGARRGSDGVWYVSQLLARKG